MKTAFLILVLAFAAYPQTNTDCTQMLSKALDEVEASRKALEADKSLIEALKAQNEAIKQLSDTRQLLIEAQDKQIIRLNAQKCQTNSFLFGIYKTKRCN